jgi:14-3-3 protein epsilon
MSSEGKDKDVSLDSSFDIKKFEELFGEKFEDKRKDLVFMARTAESAERYEDMCKCMRKLVEVCNKQEVDLTVEERNLLSVAYKNVIGARRASYRTLNAESDSKTESIISLYKHQVENELDVICNDVLSLLEEKLIKEDIEKKFETNAGVDKSEWEIVKNGSAEAQVFYLKMAGDYYRYLAEGAEEEENGKESNSKKAAEFYKRAFGIAKEALEATHPIRLGLALNYSVCHYEILKDKNKACELAKDAFDTAISKLDSLQEADYKDSTLIMQLLRDNLTLWTSNSESGDDNNEETEQVE